MTTLIVLLVIILGVIGIGVGMYNKLIAGRNRYKNAFAQIDVQLTRRHDLIPNLVETAKGYMKHEKETLEAVIDARNRAVSGLQQAAKDPSDPDAMKRLGEAEQGLSGALGRLFALAEAYPDLKANENMMQLSEELVSTENKVAFARQAYNDSVMQYNIDRESFPSNQISSWFRFQAAALLEIEDEVKREVPKVSFN
ncbi:MAG: LemA family protein [Candidatus Thiodiazotropha sp. (ex Troendleina suluensis)]|nr:LemA family protein [Candidatus Thiodiazotropha sp. (ex Troendleina suluensis)]MCU7869072.1 LemA family protein [Candidatus Thiodiazotropha sp. (ex Lucinoma borealis)]